MSLHHRRSTQVPVSRARSASAVSSADSVDDSGRSSELARVISDSACRHNEVTVANIAFALAGCSAASRKVALVWMTMTLM